MKLKSSQMALGGMMAALAVIIMSLGGMIPVATYVCPMLCTLLLQFVRGSCGNRVAWAWYGAVSLLGLLLGPDKEAAAVFCCLGYYPIIKPRMDKLPLSWLWKSIFFNAVILLMYWALIHLFGMVQTGDEFAAMGTVMLVIMLAMGNLIFFLMDIILGRKVARRK